MCGRHVHGLLVHRKNSRQIPSAAAATSMKTKKRSHMRSRLVLP